MTRILLITLFSLTLASCVSHEKTPATNHYALDVSEIDYNIEQSRTFPTLRVMPATIDPRYSSKGFVYKQSTNNYSTDPYNQFVTAPNLQISQYVMNHLYGSINAQVIDSDNLMLANYILQLNIESLYSDYTDTSHPFAKTAITATLYKITNGEARVVEQKRFSASNPTEKNNPATLIETYNLNLDEINSDMVTMINKAVSK